MAQHAYNFWYTLALTVDASQDGVKAWVPIPGPVMQVKCSEERTVAELWRERRGGWNASRGPEKRSTRWSDQLILIQSL